MVACDSKCALRLRISPVTSQRCGPLRPDERSRRSTESYGYSGGGAAHALTRAVWCRRRAGVLRSPGAQAHQLWLSNADDITGYEHTGCSASMFANRLSWTFDLRGPSKCIDTACSSSLTALAEAHAELAAG